MGFAQALMVGALVVGLLITGCMVTWDVLTRRADLTISLHPSDGRTRQSRFSAGQLDLEAGAPRATDRHQVPRGRSASERTSSDELDERRSLAYVGASSSTAVDDGETKMCCPYCNQHLVDQLWADGAGLPLPVRTDVDVTRASLSRARRLSAIRTAA